MHATWMATAHQWSKVRVDGAIHEWAVYWLILHNLINQHNSQLLIGSQSKLYREMYYHAFLVSDECTGVQASHKLYRSHDSGHINTCMWNGLIHSKMWIVTNGSNHWILCQPGQQTWSMARGRKSHLQQPVIASPVIQQKRFKCHY